MAKQDKAKDSLFLLEALVDKIIFAKPFLSEKDFKTCVIIESPNLEPLEICDEDCGNETYKKGGSVVTHFNCGKSCLFSMKDADINAAMSRFNIKATVYKCLPCGCLPEKIFIGESLIDMTKEFVQARNQFLQDPSNVSYQALKDSFRIHGADGSENGEIMMFLRLSCFGKLIVTRFQGAGVRSFGVGKSSNANSSSNFPCNAGSGANAVCPTARDIYSTQPCVDPDDPCFCSGPKPAPQQPMACRNTDQYCLHIPKGASSSRPSSQDLTEDEMKQNKEICNVDLGTESPLRRLYHLLEQRLYLRENRSMTSLSSLTTISSEPTSYVSTTDLSNRQELYQRNVIPDFCTSNYASLGKKETTVYMTLLTNNYNCPRQTSGTQATASLNKCLQVRSPFCQDSLLSCTDYLTTRNPILSRNNPNLPQESVNTNLYYCTKSTCKSNTKQKKPIPDKKGIKAGKEKDGKTSSNTSSNVSSKSDKKPAKSRDKSTSSKTSTKSEKEKEKEKKKKEKKEKAKNKKAAKEKNADEGKDRKGRDSKVKPQSSKEKTKDSSTVKADMFATVSHIIIGPKEPCPHYGREPCQGPRCLQARNSSESEAVKITNVTNSRRGVFELVIRKLNGAPLARNELMLEWTPPPSKPGFSNNTINGLPCYFIKPCRPSRSKLAVCRKAKSPCPKFSCAKCHKKCRCKVPCPPSPCASVCRPLCYPITPCKSTPCMPKCLRPCIVGYRKPRKYCSQTKIRPHKKRISPCANRAINCPVVKCRSVPGSCFGCCAVYPPRRCFSICRTRGCLSRCAPC